MPLSLHGLIQIEPDTYRDERGFVMETYHKERYVAQGISSDFVQDTHSCSQQNVIRGLKFQYNKPTDKLIRVAHGRIFAVAVDIRIDADSFGKWESVELSAENNVQLFLPFGFAFGFCALSNTADVLYKLSAFHNPMGSGTIRWDDTEIGIKWPISSPVVALADQQAPGLSEWCTSPQAALFMEALHGKGAEDT